MQRAPTALLRPFVRTLWATEGDEAGGDASIEHVLPTGTMHVVIRLSDVPVVVFEGDVPRVIGPAVIGGARSTYYAKRVTPSASVGAQLLPGAASLLFGVPASELAERHTPLGDVLAGATSLRDRLGEARSLAARLDAFEAYLLERLPSLRPPHPAVAEALARIGRESVADAVRRSGYSHRGFVALFRGAVGLTPKVFARVMRFQRAVDHVRSPGVSLAAAAHDAGYADQAHFSREFGAMAGISPARYRDLRVASPNHVPIGSSPSHERRTRRPFRSRRGATEDAS